MTLVTKPWKALKGNMAKRGLRESPGRTPGLVKLMRMKVMALTAVILNFAMDPLMGWDLPKRPESGGLKEWKLDLVIAAPQGMMKKGAHGEE